MTCKEVEKWIPLFLRDDLDTDDLREFMEHIDKCEECREELSIQFFGTGRYGKAGGRQCI